jgi:hypothetical protein
MPYHGRRIVRGMATADQVARLHRVLHDHPQVEVTHHRYPHWYYSATWSEHGERVTLKSRELRWLLNEVQDRLEEPRA